MPTAQSSTTQLCNPTRTDEASEATTAVCGVTVLADSPLPMRHQNLEVESKARGMNGPGLRRGAMVHAPRMSCPNLHELAEAGRAHLPVRDMVVELLFVLRAVHLSSMRVTDRVLQFSPPTRSLGVGISWHGEFDALAIMR